MRLARQSNGYAREGLAVGRIRAAPVLKRPERWESSWFWSHGSAEQHPTNALCGLTQTNALDHVNRRLAGDADAFSRGSVQFLGASRRAPSRFLKEDFLDSLRYRDIPPWRLSAKRSVARDTPRSSVCNPLRPLEYLRFSFFFSDS